MTARTARNAASIAATAFAALSVGVIGLSEVRLDRRYATPSASLAVRADPETVVRGRHVGDHIAQCSFCHGDDLAGKPAADDPWLGRLWAPNLTPGRGGLPRDYRDEDLARAIRNGVGRDGRSLRLMPSDQLRAMSEADLSAVIAWVRSAPPVAAERPASFAGPLTRLVLAAGLAPELLPAERIDHDAPPPPAPAPDPTPAYGEYLVGIGICRVCHRDDLGGGAHPLSLPDEPPPPDLTISGSLGGWSEADFLQTLRSGATPDGRPLDPVYMPWPRYAQMSETELRAVWAYLRTLP
ncbi:MAG: cytochrome c [Myxococcales bacterium]|nr:cytochrome c [Myxococcales bacterium]